MYECETAKYINVLEQTQGKITITLGYLGAYFWVLSSHPRQKLCDKLIGSLLELNIKPYAKILNEESRIEADIEVVEVYEESQNMYQWLRIILICLVNLE